MCRSEGVNSGAPGVTKFIAPGNSNHFLSHHASGYWSIRKAEEKYTEEDWSNKILSYVKKNSPVSSLYSSFNAFRFCPFHFVLFFGPNTDEATCTYLTNNPAAAIWWHLTAG